MKILKLCLIFITTFKYSLSGKAIYLYKFLFKNIAIWIELLFGASSCDTVSFTCINEVRSFVTWNIRSESRTLYSVSFTQLSANRSNKTLGSSIFIAEVTASNSTYVASTFTIIGSTALIGIFVGCNSMERRIISPVTAITGKHALQEFFITMTASLV